MIRAVSVHAADFISLVVDADEGLKTGLGDPNSAMPVGRQTIRATSGRLYNSADRKSTRLNSSHSS